MDGQQAPNPDAAAAAAAAAAVDAANVAVVNAGMADANQQAANAAAANAAGAAQHAHAAADAAVNAANTRDRKPLKVLPDGSRFSGSRPGQVHEFITIANIMWAMCSIGTTHQMFILCLGCYFAEPALGWFVALQAAQSAVLNNKDAFFAALRQRFGTVNGAITAEYKLRNLNQRGRPVDIYVTAFQRLVTELLQTDTMDEREQKRRFISGLDDHIRYRVLEADATANNALSLQDVITRAHLTDDVHRTAANGAAPSNSHRRGDRRNNTPHPARNASSGVVPMELGFRRAHPAFSAFAPPAAARPTVNAAQARPRTRGPISQQERARRDAAGLCRYCGEPGHYASVCPNAPPARSRQPNTRGNPNGRRGRR